MREKKIQKKYLALVHGLWPISLRKISEPLLKTQLQNKQKKVSINKEGKPSETCFRIKKQYLFTTLVSITPKTGRTHQIRVHALYAGHPILFDKRYGKRDLDSNIKNKTKINRLLLHATSINFLHPENGKKMHITAPLDVNFENYLNTLV